MSSVKAVQQEFEQLYGGGGTNGVAGRDSSSSRQQLVRTAHTKLQVLVQDTSSRLLKVQARVRLCVKR